MAKEIGLNRQISMIAAVSEALAYRRRNPGSDSEGILKFIAQSVAINKDELTKIGMIAAVTEALNIIEKQSTVSDKEVIRKVMDNIQNIISTING